jgi:hypothetical protein
MLAILAVFFWKKTRAIGMHDHVVLADAVAVVVQKHKCWS